MHIHRNGTPRCFILLAFVLLPLLLSACGVRTWWDFKIDNGESGSLMRDTATNIELSVDFSSWNEDRQRANITIRSRSKAIVEVRSADLTLQEVRGGGNSTNGHTLEPVEIQAWRGSGWNWQPTDEPVSLEPTAGGRSVRLDHAGMHFTIMNSYNFYDVRGATRVRATARVRLLLDGKPVEIEREVFLRKDVHTSVWVLSDC